MKKEKGKKRKENIPLVCLFYIFFIKKKKTKPGYYVMFILFKGELFFFRLKEKNKTKNILLYLSFLKENYFFPFEKETKPRILCYVYPF